MTRISSCIRVDRDEELMAVLCRAIVGRNATMSGYRQIRPCLQLQTFGWFLYSESFLHPVDEVPSDEPSILRFNAEFLNNRQRSQASKTIRESLAACGRPPTRSGCPPWILCRSSLAYYSPIITSIIVHTEATKETSTHARRLWEHSYTT